MKILISGGEKSENVKIGVSRSFSSSADELMVEKFIDAIPSIYTRGDYFDKALITEQSITKEYTIKDENEIRHRINKFAVGAAKRPHKASYVFLAQREDIALMVYEETRAIANTSVVLLKGPPYKATFFTTILSKDIQQFDKEWIYEPEDLYIEDEPTEPEETVDTTPAINLDDSYNVISAPDDGFGDKLFGDDDYDFPDESDSSDIGFIDEEEDSTEDNDFNMDEDDFDITDEDFNDDNSDEFTDSDFTDSDSDFSEFDDSDSDFTEDNSDFSDSNDNDFSEFDDSDFNTSQDFTDTEDTEAESTDPYGDIDADNMDGVNDSPVFDDDEYEEEMNQEKNKESEDDTMCNQQYDNGDDFMNDDDFLPGFDDDDYDDSDFGDFDEGSYEDDNNVNTTPGFSDDDYEDDEETFQAQQNRGRKPVTRAHQEIDDDMYDEPDNTQVNNLNSLSGAEAAGIAAGASAADESALRSKGKGLLGKLGKGKAKNIKKAKEVANEPAPVAPAPMVNTGNGAMIQNNYSGGLEAEASRKVRASAGKIKDGLKPFAARGNNIVVTGFGGCGTSTVAYGLSNILVQLGYNVLLVDCDTKGRAQNYISRTNYDNMPTDGANLMAAINSSTGLNKQMSIVKQGFHLLTMGMGADVQPIQEMLHKDKIGRFMTNAKSSHSFVIYDIPFDVATDFLSDVTFGADNLVTVVDSSTWGVTKMLLGICNIANEDMQDQFFNRAQLVFNKERHLNKVLGNSISSTDDILSTVDNQILELLGDDPGYYFKTMKVAGIIKDDPAVEKGWFENTHYSDTPKGQEVFLNLINNIILRRN